MITILIRNLQRELIAGHLKVDLTHVGATSSLPGRRSGGCPRGGMLLLEDVLDLLNSVEDILAVRLRLEIDELLILHVIPDQDLVGVNVEVGPHVGTLLVHPIHLVAPRSAERLDERLEDDLRVRAQRRRAARPWLRGGVRLAPRRLRVAV